MLIIDYTNPSPCMSNEVQCITFNIYIIYIMLHALVLANT